MTNVVEPGTVSPSPVRDPASPEELAEGVVDRQTMVRSSVGAGEERDIGRTGTQGVRIAPQVLAEGRRHGNEAILVVLRLANDQDSREQVDLANVQRQNLADARAAPI